MAVPNDSILMGGFRADWEHVTSDSVRQRAVVKGLSLCDEILLVYRNFRHCAPHELYEGIQ
jgi:hypothetical protein